VAQFASGVSHYDQAVSLDDLKARIIEEVEDARIAEVVARSKFTERKLTRGIMNFATGALVAAITSKENPLLKGAHLFRSALDDKAPFDTVLVAIGQKGLPEDVRVVPLSSLARQSNRSESDIGEALRRRGCLLMTPQTFTTLVDNLRSRVLEGSLYLPVSIESIVGELRGIMSSHR